ncbi:signal peptidase I [Rhodococcus sp. KBS0724]|uniref:signal peptidase I n=1 Tax=Rhodococcus sp. KBS0724 TaxID=1179674 RepID=UPI00163DC27E|nr:signal peptidase I [Rhodococcus sp. KBS0724]
MSVVEHGTTSGTVARHLRESALTVGAVLGVMCVVAALASWMFGVTPLVFTSGSMSPSIETGALGFARTVDADDLAVGDVVSVTNTSGTRISHRIEQITPQGDGTAALVLKGDANDQSDLEPYVVADADRILFSVNKAGYVVAWLSGPSGAFLGGIVACALLFIAFRRPPRDTTAPNSTETTVPPTDQRAVKPKSAGTAKSVVALGAVGLAVLGATHTTSTRADFTSTATVTGLSFTAASTITVAPAAPVLSKVMCSSLLVALTMSWDAVPGATGYRIIVRDSNQIQVGSTDQTALSYTAFGTLNLQNGTYLVEVHSMNGLAVSPGWSGWTINYTIGLLVSCGSRTSGTSQAGALRMAAPAAPATTTTSTTTAPTTSATETPLTTTSSVAPTSTTPPTPTTSTGVTTEETTTSTTPSTTTPTTTTPVTTATTTPVETPLGDATSSGQFTAETVSTSSGNVVIVSDQSGVELFRTPVDPSTELHWLSGTNELWLINSAGVRKVDASTGAWTKSTVTGTLPDEIQELVSP